MISAATVARRSDRGQRSHGAAIKSFGALCLEFHERPEAPIVNALAQIRGRIAEALQILEGQINAPPVVQVGADIPDNVRQLQRQPKINRELAAGRRPAAEDFDAHQAHDARDAMAIGFQLLEKSRIGAP